MRKYLRHRKGLLLEKRKAQIECRPQPKIVRLQRVCIIPLGQNYDESLRGREDLIFEDTGFCSQISTSTENEYTYKRIIYGGYLRRKWGHFITESLARMWALDKPEISDYEKILFFSDSDADSIPEGNFLQVFELLGIAERVVIATSNVTAEELIVPEPGYEHDRFYTEVQAEVYRKIIANALQSTPSVDLNRIDKIFISRASIPGASQNAVNLIELETYFKENGFEIISPEKTSLIDLIHIMNKSDTVATIGGSPAHNFVFINRPETKRLIIIERHAWLNDFQISLNKMCGCDTIYVDGYYLPKAASSQDGLMLFAPTPQFCKFAVDFGLSNKGYFADDNRKTRKRELRKFLSRYRRYWCSGDALCPWEIDSGEAIAEAMVASRERYAEWLQDSLPVMWYDYLSPRALVRMALYYLRKKRNQETKAR